MSSDQLRFAEHLKIPEFRQGEIRGWWVRVTGIEKAAEWPFSLFWIAVPPRNNSPIDKYYLHLEFSNYNVDAPAGCFWSPEKNQRLDNALWPMVTGPYAQAFRTDWRNPHEL